MSIEAGFLIQSGNHFFRLQRRRLVVRDLGQRHLDHQIGFRLLV